MKRPPLFPLLAAALATATMATAQSTAPDDKADAKPAAGEYEPFPNFDFGDLHVEQKYSMSVGFRMLSGAEISFSGNGSILATQETIGIGEDGPRNYHDGYVRDDQRPGSSDGMTNTWSATHPDQLVNGGADIAMHNYSAVITDTAVRHEKQSSDVGAELLVERDMGRLGGKLQWKLFAAVGLNGISGATRSAVDADVTTLRDLYALGGKLPTEDGLPPYRAPSTIVDPDDPQKLIDTTTLLSQKPHNRSETTLATDDQVFTAWKVKGNFLSLRLGPTLSFDVGQKLRFSVSGGPVLLYAGSTYTVESLLVAETGEDIVQRMSDDDSQLMTGYYFDATLQYMITERAGFYAGAFFQTGSDYTQHIDDEATNSHYSTDIDLARLQGFRAGLNYRF